MMSVDHGHPIGNNWYWRPLTGGRDYGRTVKGRAARLRVKGRQWDYTHLAHNVTLAEAQTIAVNPGRWVEFENPFL